MSLIAKAMMSLFALYREAVAAGDLEAMERIGAAAEAMEADAVEDLSSMLGDPPAHPVEIPEASQAGEKEPGEPAVVPETKRLAHPEGSGIVIGTTFVPSDRIQRLPTSKRMADSSIQRQRSERPSNIAARQRAAKWIAEDRK